MSPASGTGLILFYQKGTLQQWLEAMLQAWRHLLLQNTNAQHAMPGWAVFEQAKKRGLVEDVRLNCEVMVTASFDNARWLIRRLLLMPDPRKQSNITDDHDLQAPLDLVCLSLSMIVSCQHRLHKSRCHRLYMYLMKDEI